MKAALTILILIPLILSGQRVEVLLETDKKWDGETNVDFHSDLLLEGGTILIIEGKEYAAKLDERLSRGIYKISLYDSKGMVCRVLLNMRLKAVFVIRSKKQIIKYYRWENSQHSSFPMATN